MGAARSRPVAWKTGCGRRKEWERDGMRERRDTEGLYLERSLRGEWPHYFWPRTEERERETERKRGIQSERGRELREGEWVSEGRRECEGEIEQVWFSSTQLLTATAVTSLHLFALPLCSSLIPSFLPFFFPSNNSFPLGSMPKLSRLHIL